MTTLTPNRPAQETPARQRALGAYVLRARGWCLERAADAIDGTISLRLSDRSLTLDRAEFSMLLREARVEASSCGPGGQLGLEIFALLTKCLEDLASLRNTSKPTSSEMYALQAELMLDSALGTALLADSQGQINLLLAEGDQTRAEPLTRLRQRLRKSVAEVGQSIAESERERAQVLAGTFTQESLAATHACEIDLEDPELLAAATPARPQRTLKRSTSQASPATPTEPTDASRLELSATTFLGAGLALALLVWLLAFVLPGLKEPSFRLLAASDFPSDEILRQVDARPPSLFVRVDGAAWSALDDTDRTELLEEMSRVLERHDYSGAFIETEQGLPVAQWLRERGPELIAVAESAAF
jgi:hypothetical protein